nr:MAG TPA: Terminase large subunit [Caudoviricetes sp.]
MRFKDIDNSLDLIKYEDQCVQEDIIYVKPGIYAMSSRKIDSLIKIAYLQKYYQCNPVRFINDFFNIELLDAQAWIVQQSWTCPNVLLVCSRGFGKSTLIDIIIMSKDMLFNNYWTYIASGSGSQAEQTFTTLERLANDNIDTMMGSTGYIFKAEVEIKNAAGDGFSHGSNGFSYSTYNGSFTQTLNSNIDKKRGMRGNVIFDECGFLSDEMMSVYSAFAIVNKSFKSGKDRDGNRIDEIRLRAIPKEIPNQKFYISSASDTSTKYYSLYREFSKRMIMGDKDYFVANITCEVPLHPTIHGQVMAPLFEKSTIDSDMRTNPEKARREYYCEFTTDAGSDAIIRRGVITRNEEVRKPLLYNDTGDKKFVIAYDPARSRDNSVILVGEIYDYEQVDGSFDTRMRLVNCINLIDVGKKIKSPMQTPDQIEYLKKVILDYNAGADAYGNIVGVYIDAGSGGGGVNIADYLMPDWTDTAGIVHRGLIDKEYSAEYVKKFPNAVDKIHLMSPTAFKSEMYEAMIELINQDKVSFTAPYDNKGYLTIFDVDEEKLSKEKERISKELRKQKLNEKEFESKLSDELGKIQSVNTKTVKLDWQDEIALANMDALKEELVNMVRKKRESGKDSFELTPEKANKLHDDRSYTCCMASFALMCERRKAITQKKRHKTDSKSLLSKLSINQPKRQSSFSKVF